MPHFCFVLSWPFEEKPGGVNEVVRNLIRQFHNRPELGLQPSAMELRWKGRPDDEPLPGVTRSYFRLHSPFVEEKPLLSVLSFLLYAPGELWRLARFAKTKKIAAFNIHYPDLQNFGFVLAQVLGLFEGLVIISFHGTDIRTALGAKWFSKALWRFMLRHASAVVSCSDGLREEILMLEPRCRCVTIHNGIDIVLFESDANPAFVMPARLQGRRSIIHVGSFDFGKGQDIIVKAFIRVAAKYPDVALLLIGRSGKMSAPLREMIREAGLGERAEILEDIPHSQIYNYFAQSSVFVFASRWRKGKMGEGFAIVILEAAVANLPIVATASCGVEEIIRNGETGLVVPLEDDVKLAEAITRVLDDPESAKERAERLNEIVRASFTWAQAADRYIDLVKPAQGK